MLKKILQNLFPSPRTSLLAFYHIGFSVSISLSIYMFSSVKSLSRVRLFETPWITAHQASLSITISWSSLKLMSIKSVMPSNHLVLCRPLLPLLPIPPSIRVFSNESTLRIRWPKYWSFSFSISPFNEHPGLISFRMDWLDLLAVQGTLKSLLQHHSSKAALNMPANLENSAVATGLEKVNFHSNSKERQCQRMFKLPHNCTHLTC